MLNSINNAIGLDNCRIFLFLCIVSFYFKLRGYLYDVNKLKESFIVLIVLILFFDIIV